MWFPKLSPGVERVVSTSPLREQVQASPATCTGVCIDNNQCSNGCVCTNSGVSGNGVCVPQD